MPPRLTLTRAQVLAVRRLAGALDVRLPAGRRSLRLAGWAGLQDSVPRAALLSIHARVERIGPNAWEEPSLVQIWGPRHSSYVVPARDLAVFTLGLLPEDPRKRADAEDIAMRLQRFLRGRRMPVGPAAAGISEHHWRLRLAAPTGRVLIRWDGAREPTVWCVTPPEVDPRSARLELVRRFLRVFGPTTSPAFAAWAGLAAPSARAAFVALERELIPVRTPLGDAWLLARDEAPARASAQAPVGARLLPSGDAYLLGTDRELLVPVAERRRALWPPGTVWPGGVLLDGELVGTWRRAHDRLTVAPWRRLSRSARGVVEAEASALPIPGVASISVRWEERMRRGR